jgi:hypothetical protein
MCDSFIPSLKGGGIRNLDSLMAECQGVNCERDERRWERFDVRKFFNQLPHAEALLKDHRRPILAENLAAKMSLQTALC